MCVHSLPRNPLFDSSFSVSVIIMLVLKNLLLPTGTILLLSQLAVGQSNGPGPCHPYPGAAATDCLQLIGENLNNDATLSCGSTSSTSASTLTLGSCSITIKCTGGPVTVETSLAVRRALTTIGTCALSDYGSISGYYLADDGTKTCYLFPGQ